MSAERIAQRIGMKPCHLHSSCGVWRDRGYPVANTDLPTYLATGDRPMRIQAAYGMRTSPMLNGRSEVVGWSVSSLEGHASVAAHELAAAILALAERLEAERE